MSVSIFKTPSIFMLIEKYISWRDFIHIMCTCRELYFEWVSNDPQRWKNLRIPRYICKHVLKIPVSKEIGPVMEIRKRATKALVENIRNNYSSFPCMGGCGQYVLPISIISRDLYYAVCMRCAICSGTTGQCITQRYLKKNGYTDEFGQVGFEHARLKLGKEMFCQKYDAIEQLWFRHYSKKLKAIPGWKIPVYSIKSIQIQMELLLKKQGFIKT